MMVSVVPALALAAVMELLFRIKAELVTLNASSLLKSLPLTVMVTCLLVLIATTPMSIVEPSLGERSTGLGSALALRVQFVPILFPQMYSASSG